jgi:hypothetical protein
LKAQITISVYKCMRYSTQEASAGSSGTIPVDERREEEAATAPTILISESSYGTTTASVNEPGLSSRRGIHKTIRLPSPSTVHEIPLSTAALMKRVHELDPMDIPITPVEKLIPSNPSSPPPAPISKKIRVRHLSKPVWCENKLYTLSPSNSGEFSSRSPLAPHSMNTGPLASPIQLVDPNPIDPLHSPVSEKVIGSLGTNPVCAVATD